MVTLDGTLVPSERAAERGASLVSRYLGFATMWWAVPWLILSVYAASHYWLCDDAHISFRYALNLFQGHGLVFNVGERVEGYTNFLWLLEVGLLSVFGIPMPVGATVLSVLATVGTLWLTIRAARQTAFRSFVGLAAWTALALLATNRNIAVFTTSGLETRQFTFLLLLALGLACRGLAREGAARQRAWLAASLAFGALELTRPEGALLGACAIAWVGLELARRGAPALALSRWLQALLPLAVPFAAVVIAHYVGRYMYYDEWLPNTFYTKVVRPWPDMGILYYGAALLESGGYLTLPLALLGGYLRWVRRRDSSLGLVLFVLVPHALYLINVGGDHFEFRPLDFYWPLIALGVADTMAAFAFWLRLTARRRRWWRPAMTWRVPWAAALCVLLAYTTVLPLGQYVHEHPHRTDPEIAGHIADAPTPETFPLAGALPMMDSIANAYALAMKRLIAHNIGVRWVEHRVFEQKVQRLYGVYNRPDRARFPESSIMSFSWMGIGPFALPEVTIIDNFGLTDKVVARNREPRNEERSMAHDRRAPAGYMKQRGVNLRIQPAAQDWMTALRAAPFALRLTDGLWAPFHAFDDRWVRSAFRDLGLFHLDWRRPARSIIDGRNMVGADVVLDCEEPLDDWQVQGVSCLREPGRMQSKVTGFEGKAWLSTYDRQRGDATVGEAISPPFIPRPGDALIFKIGGGSAPATRAALVDVAGEELVRWQGKDREELEPVMQDLEQWAGQALRFRISDETRGPWGHLLVDAVIVLRATPETTRSVQAPPAEPSPSQSPP